MTAYFMLSPMARGCLCWAAFALMVLDVSAIAMQGIYHVPGKKEHLLRCVGEALALWVCMLGQALLAGGEMERYPLVAWAMCVPAVVVEAALAGIAVEVSLSWRRIRLWTGNHISRNSVKEGIDMLPCAICFYRDDGLPLLTNHAMHCLCARLTGEPLENGLQIWQIVMEESAGQGISEEKEKPILRLADESVWSFCKASFFLGGRRVHRMTAVEISQEYALTLELRKKNEQIRKMNGRLAAYGRTVEESTREQEVLATKARIHDELGKALLVSRRCILAEKEEREKALQMWKQIVTLFLCEEEPAPREDPFGKLAEAAQSIGVEMIMEGELPTHSAAAARCMLAAAHECLTNAVRHADASTLYIHGARENGFWHIRYANDGKAPSAPIREAGGLGGLRRMVEAEGGEMRIVSQPCFILEVIIQSTEEEAACPIEC